MEEKRLIPANARCVFKGVLNEVWQWEQELFDGSIRTYEAVRRADTVVILAVTEDKKIIVQEQESVCGYKYICLPSGRADRSENRLQEAKREFLEETGYVSDDWRLMETLKPPGKLVWNVHRYLAKNCRKMQDQNLDPDEKIRVRQVTFDEFLELSDDPLFRGFELTETMLRARLKPEKKKEFEKLLLG
jgi:8-oxo-dGTP pyrophosphatase MutT (NUDIX family)